MWSLVYGGTLAETPPPLTQNTIIDTFLSTSPPKQDFLFYAHSVLMFDVQVTR